MDELMDRFDPDGDEKIDYSEFLRMVAQNGHGRAYKSRDVVKLVDTLRLKIRKRARNA